METIYNECNTVTNQLTCLSKDLKHIAIVLSHHAMETVAETGHIRNFTVNFLTHPHKHRRYTMAFVFFLLLKIAFHASGGVVRGRRNEQMETA